MNRIDTEINSAVVEIEGKEYPVAEKTIDIADRLITVQRRLESEPAYKLWLAELEILLGKSAVKELFVSGKHENIDRIQRIHDGVVRAFDINAEELRDEQTERQTEQLAPVTKLLNQLFALSKADTESTSKPTIRRPQ